MRREKRPGIGFLNESAAHTALSWSSRLTSYRLAIPVGRLAAPTYSAVLQVGQGGVQVVHPSRPRARHKHEAQPQGTSTPARGRTQCHAVRRLRRLAGPTLSDGEHDGLSREMQSFVRRRISIAPTSPVSKRKHGVA